MLENITLPPELESFVGSETRDFAVKAKHANPPKTSLALIIFGAYGLLYQYILFASWASVPGKEVHFLTNDVHSSRSGKSQA
jgi:hypothetical protein